MSFWGHANHYLFESTATTTSLTTRQPPPLWQHGNHHLFDNTTTTTSLTTRQPLPLFLLTVLSIETEIVLLVTGFCNKYYLFLNPLSSPQISLPTKTLQSHGDFLLKWSLQKFRKIYKTVPIPESLFNKVVNPEPSTWKKTLELVFSCKFGKFFKNICKQLLQ